MTGCHRELTGDGSIRASEVVRVVGSHQLAVRLHPSHRLPLGGKQREKVFRAGRIMMLEEAVRRVDGREVFVGQASPRISLSYATAG